jgi:hypothetical protein
MIVRYHHGHRDLSTQFNRITNGNVRLGTWRLAAKTNISLRYFQKLFAERNRAHFTQKFRRRFRPYHGEPGADVGNTTVRAGAGESALLARNAWSRLT